MIPDSEILQALQTGDELALKQLIELFQHKVYNTALSILQMDEEAEEITQDVFIEVYKSAKKFDGKSSLSTWIYRITVNKSLDCLRYLKRKKRGGILNRLFGAEKESNARPDFYHPGVEMEQKELSLILFKAIDRLPEKQKTVFLLFHVEGVRQQEIADILQTSVKAIESLLMRAKENLKKELGDYYKNNFK